jgi:5-methylcytosine-specific restriction enzyme A
MVVYQQRKGSFLLLFANNMSFFPQKDIRRLSDGGPDDPRWVAAICPNCHREAHYGENGEELNQQLLERLEIIET